MLGEDKQDWLPPPKTREEARQQMAVLRAKKAAANKAGQLRP